MNGKGQPAGGLQVRVEAEGCVGQWIMLETSDSPVTVALDPGLTMRGRVFLPDGTPASGAWVRYAPKPRNTRGPAGDVMETGPTGEFVLSGLNPEDREAAYMTVSLEGHAVEALEPPTIDSGLGESDDIRLEEAQPLPIALLSPGIRTRSLISRSCEARPRS